MDQTTRTLGLTDYAVIAGTMGISIGIGIYYRFSGGRQKTIQEYFSADKSMSIVPVAIALMVSFVSGITMLGVSAENYTYGTQFFVINFAYLIGTPIVCYCYMPVFFNVGAISAYEYLERRFGRVSRSVVSIIYWIQLLMYSGVVLYAPALTLKATTNVNEVWSIVGIGLICTFYSCIGGMKAVLMTDVFQGILMYISIVVVIFSAVNIVGLNDIWRIASEGQRIEFDSFSFDPTVRHTWWGLLIGGLVNCLSTYGVNQIQVQRMMSTKNIKSARLALWFSWPILIILSGLICFSGLAMYSYYHKCDPTAAGKITKPDKLMPQFVMDTLSHIPGLPGLFVAGIFSAGLSTISAGLNSLAAVTLEDFIKPIYVSFSGREITNSKSIIYSKLLVLILGIFCIGFAFAAQLLGGILQTTLTIFGVVGGPLLGIFTLGMLFESVNEIGAVAGTSISFIFCLWIAFGQPKPVPQKLPVSTENCLQLYNISISVTKSIEYKPIPPSYFYLFRISYIWFSVIGFIVAMIVGYVVSHISRVACKKCEDEVDPNLLFPFIAKRKRNR